MADGEEIGDQLIPGLLHRQSMDHSEEGLIDIGLQPPDGHLIHSFGVARQGQVDIGGLKQGSSAAGSPQQEALIIDPAFPRHASRLHGWKEETWPRADWPIASAVGSSKERGSDFNSPAINSTGDLIRCRHWPDH